MTDDAPEMPDCPRCGGKQISTLRVVFEGAMQRLHHNPADAQARLLATQTAPPRRRDEQKSFKLVIVLLIGLSVSVLLARIPRVASAMGGFPLWIAVAVPGLLLTMASLIQSTRSTTWNQNQLPKAVRAWAERRVCMNCGTTFSAPAERLVAFATTGAKPLVPSPVTPGAA